MNGSRPDVEYVKGYSIALLSMAPLFLLGALTLQFLFSMTFLSSMLCLLGFSCLAVSRLRWVRAAPALPATAALSFSLLLAFPFGTALSVYWLASVRPKEAIPQDVSQRTWFNYTVVLYILGLLLLLLDATVLSLLALPGPQSRALDLVRLGIFVVAVAVSVIAIAVLRSTRPYWAHWATLLLNMFLIFWFPFGTVLALVWFFTVYKHERELLS